MRDAMVHLFARYLEMRPLFLAAARPIKVEWKMRPYLGVLPRVFRALGKHHPLHIKSMMNDPPTTETLRIVALKQVSNLLSDYLQMFLIFYLCVASGCSDCGGAFGRGGSLQRRHQFLLFSSYPALLLPSPAITAATFIPSREGAPQYLNRAFSAPRI